MTGELGQLITSIGFPSVACVLMAAFCKDLVNNTIGKVMDEMANTREVLAENTEATKNLCSEIRERNLV